MLDRHILGSCAIALAMTLASGLAQGVKAEPRSDRGSHAHHHGQGKSKWPLIIQEQGSFFVGGEVITADDGLDTFHGDHAYVQYQIPRHPRELPLVMWHGGGQSAKTWESTPDGREGYQSIFLRRDFAVYIVDQPRRGRAGRTTEGTTIPDAFAEGTNGDSFYFDIFRLGVWPEYFPGVQFPHESEVVNLPIEEPLEQYFRQITPDTGPSEPEVDAAAVAALFDEVGPGVLITHSASGIRGWLAAARSDNIEAIISYEPVQFSFPEGEVPAANGPQFPPLGIPADDFEKLTKIPIQIVYGDYLDQHPYWVEATANAEDFVEAVNAAGGDASILYLADIDVLGNTHFPFSDLNNLEIADLLSHYLKEKSLDRR